MRWMEAHWDEATATYGAAQVSAMSQRNFLRRFKVETGQTPTEYLQGARQRNMPLAIADGSASRAYHTSMRRRQRRASHAPVAQPARRDSHAIPARAEHFQHGCRFWKRESAEQQQADPLRRIHIWSSVQSHAAIALTTCPTLHRLPR